MRRELIKLIGIDDDWTMDAMLGLGFGVAFLMVTSITSISMATPAPIYPLYALPEVVNALSSLLLIGFLAPVTEEIIFRGGIFRFGRGVVSKPLAMILTGIAFAVFHWAAYGESLLAAYVGAFMFSTVACLIVLHTKSLLPAIIMHSIVNVFLFIQSEQMFVIGT